jgi:osmotically-inducible protein OsmY
VVLILHKPNARTHEVRIINESTMKRIISISVFALLVAAPVGLVGCSTTRGVQQQNEDRNLAQRVGRRLTADPEVQRFEIDVDALDKVVTLRGQVDTQSEADAAAAIARNTEGVDKVVNKLMVGSEGSGNSGTESAPRSDAGIRAAVGTRLMADPEVRRMNIDVDVVDGIVYLSGVVEDSLARDTAERIASKVDGVVRVDNELQIDAGIMPADKQPQTEGDNQPDGGENPESHTHGK